MNKLDFIYKRKSIRKFKDQEVPKEDILKMLDAAIHAPSAHHCQNWYFVVVQDKNVINEIVSAVKISHEKIAEMAKNEKDKEHFLKLMRYYLNFKDASTTVIVYGGPYKTIEEKILRENNVDEEIITELNDSMPGIQSIGAAVENFLLAATALGYGTCYMTGPNHAKKEIEKIINLDKEGYSLLAMIALGVPEDNTPAQPLRKSLDDVVTFI